MYVQWYFGLFLYFEHVLLECENGHAPHGLTLMQVLRRAKSSFHTKHVKMAKCGGQTNMFAWSVCLCVCWIKICFLVISRQVFSRIKVGLIVHERCDCSWHQFGKNKRGISVWLILDFTQLQCQIENRRKLGVLDRD